MMRLGERSAKVPPWSGLEISTRPTLKVAVPMEISEPRLAPMPAISFESSHTSPGVGMPVAGVPATNGSSAISTLPRNG
jgi:hypothetical protein